MTIYGRIYHYIGALSPSYDMRAFVLSVHIRDNDFLSQTESLLGAISQLRTGILQQLAAMMHAFNPYVQSFVSLQEWVPSPDETCNFHMGIPDERRPSAEHIRLYNGPIASEAASIVPNVKYKIVCRRVVVLRRRGELNSIVYEVLEYVSVTPRSYDFLNYVLFFPFDQNGWCMYL